MPDSDHRPVVEAPLQELRGAACYRLPLRLRIGAAGSHDGVGEAELLAQAGLKIQVQPGRRRDPDVHYAGPAGPLKQPLDLGPRETELARDLLLGPPVDVVALGDPSEALEVFGDDFISS